MSKTIMKSDVTQVRHPDDETGTRAGYQCTIKLDDGEIATSIVFDSADECNAWAADYAEDAKTGADEPKSAEIAATTTAHVDPGGDPSDQDN